MIRMQIKKVVLVCLPGIVVVIQIACKKFSIFLN